MTGLVGHRAVRAQLETDLPPVVLLRGPRSIGKTTMALHLAGHHRVLPVDLRQIDATLSIDTVRELRQWSTRAGFGPFKLIIACLDGASLPAQHALLKTLEEPPACARFLLTAAEPVLATVASRCRIYPLGRLSEQEVVTVLTAHGIPTAKAVKAAALAAGQVDVAMANRYGEDTRRLVLDLVRALAGHDQVLLDTALAGATEDVRDLLDEWVCEAVTRRFLLFSESEMFEVHRDQARVRRLLVNLSTVRAARPRLALRAALQPLL